MISVRAGCETSIIFANPSGRFPDFSGGIGLHYSNIAFDYGLKIPGSGLGFIHNFSLSFMIPE
jgi:hypothetical protein